MATKTFTGQVVEKSGTVEIAHQPFNQDVVFTEQYNQVFPLAAAGSKTIDFTAAGEDIATVKLVVITTSGSVDVYIPDTAAVPFVVDSVMVLCGTLSATNTIKLTNSGGGGISVNLRVYGD